MAPQVNQTALLIGGLIGGMLCGLIPFGIGLKSGKKTLAYVAMATCIACGAFLGALLALPVALVFVVILKYA